MADPITLLGTIPGLISLGIDACERLTNYIDGIRSRDEELGATKSYCDDLKYYLATLREWQAENLDTPSDIALANALGNCDKQLLSLQNLMQELAGSNAKNTIINQKWKDIGKRITYPFKRSNIERLENRLRNANEALSAILRLVQLKTTTSISRQMSELRIQGGSSNVHLVAARAGLSDNTANVLAMSQKSDQILDHVSRFRCDMQSQSIGFREEQRLMSTKMANMEDRLHQAVELLQAMSSTQRSPIQLLVEKPDSCRRVCDAFEMRNSLSHPSCTPTNEVTESLDLSWPRGSSPPACQCAQNVRKTMKKLRWGTAEVFSQSELQEHDPACPQYSIQHYTKARTIGLSYASMHKFLSTGIAASFCANFGAGGVSISQNVNFFPVVDSNASPGFRIVKALRVLLGRTVYLWREMDKSIDINALRVVSQTYCKRKLQDVYVRGDAHPRALSQDGCSVADVLIMDEEMDILKWFVDTDERYDSWIGLLNTVAPWGLRDSHSLPRSRSDDRLHDIIRWQVPGNRLATRYLNDIVIPLAQDSTNFALSLNPHFIQSMELCDSRHVLEALGVSQLSAAVIRRDDAALSSLLNRGHRITETDIVDGCNALHLSATWSLGLELLVNSNPGPFLHRRDFCGRSPLCLALQASHQLCMDDTCSPENHTCHKCVDILLRAGAMPSGTLSPLKSLTIATPTSCYRVLDHLKAQRENLKSLAMRFLPSIETTLLGLNDSSVLDSNVGMIRSTLRQQGGQEDTMFEEQSGCRDQVDMQDLLEVIDPHENQWLGKCVYQIMLACAYQYDHNAHAACEYAFQLGFHDVQAMDDHTLVKAIAANQTSDFSVKHWLMTHGISPLRKIKVTDHFETTAANLALYMIADMSSVSIMFNEMFSLRWANSLLKIPTTGDVHDDCTCHCSCSGCTPLVSYIKGLDQSFQEEIAKPYRTQPVRLPIDNISSFLIGLEMNEQTGDSSSLPQELVRFLTFRKLGLRHTCCQFAAHSFIKDGEHPVATICEIKEVERIQDEDEELLHLFENLVCEFEHKFVELGCCLSKFISEYWSERMEEVIQELEKPLPQEEVNQIKALGVIIGPFPKEAGEPKKREQIWVEHFEKYGVEGIIDDFKKTIDEIAGY